MSSLCAIKIPFLGRLHSVVALRKKKYFGFKCHLVTPTSGLIPSCEMAAANIDERDILPELVHNCKGLMIADKDLMRPGLKEELKDYGFTY